jgi:hypothetical protein
MITGFVMMMQTGGKSYFQWALCISTALGKQISKQALFKRVDKSWIKLLKKLLAEVMCQTGLRTVKPELYCNFKRVLLQDSTTINLPKVMSERFKGNISRGEQKAVAKINVVIDLLSGLCPVLKLTSFTVNEQSLSSGIIEVAHKGDLVIRDLGYFVLPVLSKMHSKGIHFLSRLKSQVYLYNENGQQLQLTKLLNGKSWIDTEVLCGKYEKLKVRLVAIKLSSAQAAERKRKARKDRDKRLNHSEDYYALLDYVIFITTVSKQTWNYKEVADAYRMRWNIEIIFKSWKSNLAIETMIPHDIVYTERVESFLYLILLYIAWFQLLIFVPLKYATDKKNGKQLSLLKITKYVMTNLSNWLFEPLRAEHKKMLTYFCCYDRRSKPNAVMGLDVFYRSLS